MSVCGHHMRFDSKGAFGIMGTERGVWLSLSIGLTKTPSVFLLAHNISREEMTLDGELCMFITM